MGSRGKERLSSIELRSAKVGMISEEDCAERRRVRTARGILPPMTVPPLRRVTAGRYVQPLREGGSLPAVVDTDGGLFVVKFRGAGQGPKALVAELIVGGIAARLELAVP